MWVDHCDLSSDLDHDEGTYDSLLGITRGSDYLTITNNLFHDHYKTSLVGHSDQNGDQDKGKLHVTFANNHWRNVKSCAPSFRFGTGHIFKYARLPIEHRFPLDLLYVSASASRKLI